ncbi:PQQ-binding-like beta-propeller repeat protein [Streptomyces sp. NPDC020807]|uniref:protein kinase domain-containing protein n=1 Tax=Streptomyces sp. NPDC020807 TaxID=3155119 RepID=UPI0033E2797E
MLSPLTHDDPAAVATYRLLARLGSGGMGTVYLARSPGGRTVALKTVHARLAADPAFRARFRLETDAARIIGARHGAAVVDADPLAETPWLATEYVLGPPLDDAVALAGPLPEPTVRALGAALAGALAQLHSSDVVHRDLKPSNVLVTAYGPKIIDFGIARAAGDDHLTRTGAAAGTPAFMSPEQASGEEHPPAGDVFALAGVLVFAATGHGPFGTGSPADLLYRVRYADPDLAGVPAGLVPVLTACLAKDPAARPTTAALVDHLHDGHGEFADHLPPPLLADIARRATDVWTHTPRRLPAPAESATAPTAADRGRTPRLSRRRLLTFGGGALVGTAAAGGGLWAWLGSRDDTPPGATPTAAGPTAVPATTAADGAPKAAWRAESLDREERAMPLVAGGVVGFTETVSFRAFDGRSGAMLWEDGLVDPEQITTDGTYFYVSEGPSDGPSALTVRMLAVRTGEEASRKVTIKGFEGSQFGTQLLAAAGGRLFAASRIGDRSTSETGWHLIAVDPRTGKVTWREPYAWDGVRPWLAEVVGDRLVLGKNSGDWEDFVVQVRDARTGRLLWRKSVPLKDSLRYKPGQLAADDRHLYLGGDRLRALRLTDGGTAWEYGKGGSFGVPVVSDGLVYVSEGGRGIVAVGAGQGTKAWEEAPSGRNLSPEPLSTPVVGTTHVYAPVRGGLSAIDRGTRRSVWVFPTDATRYVVDTARTRIIGAGPSSVVALPYA